MPGSERLIEVSYSFEPGDIVRLKDPDSIQYESEHEQSICFSYLLCEHSCVLLEFSRRRGV